ncbi:hypothetical protein ACWD4K_18670 [Streptomyces gelaticus]
MGRSAVCADPAVRPSPRGTAGCPAVGREPAAVAEGTTTAHRRILSLAAPVTATSVRVKVLESRPTPHPGATTLHLSTTP